MYLNCVSILLCMFKLFKQLYHINIKWEEILKKLLKMQLLLRILKFIHFFFKVFEWLAQANLKIFMLLQVLHKLREEMKPESFILGADENSRICCHQFVKLYVVVNRLVVPPTSPHFIFPVFVLNQTKK